MTLGVYIPTRGRPTKLHSIVLNLKDTTRNPFKIYWGIEPFDSESIEAARKTGYPIILNRGKPTYSDALQTIYEQTSEPIFLWANDDFLFLKDWDVEPLRIMKEKPEIGVLGVPDGNPSTQYSTISFIRRNYIEEESGVVDIPGRVLYPYSHNFVDNELTETAQNRGVWDKSTAPCIEHQHYSFTWLGNFPKDATYEKNDRHFAEDMVLYNSRRHLWT